MEMIFSDTDRYNNYNQRYGNISLVLMKGDKRAQQ